MSSSYFEAQPESGPSPSNKLDIPAGSGFETGGLLSPQVSRILDDLDLEDKSSSEEHEENASLSGGSSSDKDTNRDHKSKVEHDRGTGKLHSSPLSGGGSKAHSKSSATRPSAHSKKNPHLARFHSLRSMLFSSHIEDDIQKHNERRMQAQAEARWKAEHDLRRGLNRPKTPEGPNATGGGLVSRVKGGMQRMASKGSPPPMASISEDNASTASDDEEEEKYHSDEENISHSDVEDLVRWVSKRDPPSDGEARRRDESNKISKTDSGHESLGHSDVDELVRWVSRKDDPQSRGPQKASTKPDSRPKEVAVQRPSYDSDASTESDSEGGATRPSQQRTSIDDQDVDELVRWVSRKDGPNAGPVGRKTQGTTTTAAAAGVHPSTGSEDAKDSHTEELVRWVTKQDETSGESDAGSTHDLPDMLGHANPREQTPPHPRSGSGLKTELPQTQHPAAMESETALTHEDVDDLVRWVSRNDTRASEVERNDDRIFEWGREEEELRRVREGKRLT